MRHSVSMNLWYLLINSCLLKCVLCLCFKHSIFKWRLGHFISTPSLRCSSEPSHQLGHFVKNFPVMQSHFVSTSICCKNRFNLFLYSVAIEEIQYKSPISRHIYIYIYIFMLFVYHFHKGDIHFHAQGLNELTEMTVIARSLIRRQWGNHLLGLG